MSSGLGELSTSSKGVKIGYHCARVKIKALHIHTLIVSDVARHAQFVGSFCGGQLKVPLVPSFGHPCT